jgi:hypothetical protein
MHCMTNQCFSINTGNYWSLKPCFVFSDRFNTNKQLQRPKTFCSTNRSGLWIIMKSPFKAFFSLNQENLSNVWISLISASFVWTRTALLKQSESSCWLQIFTCVIKFRQIWIRSLYVNLHLWIWNCSKTLMCLMSSAILKNLFGKSRPY